MSRSTLPYVIPGRPVFHDTECQHVRRWIGLAKMQVVVTADGLRRCKHCERGEEGRP